MSFDRYEYADLINDGTDGEVVDETPEAIEALTSRSSVALPGSAGMGIRRRWHNEPDGSVTVHTAQDVRSILGATKELNKQMHGQRAGDFGALAGKIPLGIYTDMRRRARTEHELEELVVAWMNDSDNSCFRAWPGRLEVSK